MAGNIYAAGSGQPAGQQNPFPIAVFGSKYQDLGLVIDAVNMAAGATTYSSWYDNVDWVRNIIALVSSDQQYDLVIQRRDSTLTGTFDISLATAQAANPGAWRGHPQSGANGVAGFSVRFGIKNSSATANTYGRVRIQLLGL